MTVKAPVSAQWILSPSLLATVPAISSHSASVVSPGSVLQSIMHALRIGPISKCSVIKSQQQSRRETQGTMNR